MARSSCGLGRAIWHSLAGRTHWLLRQPSDRHGKLECLASLARPVPVERRTV